jgi:hypothetical protein
VYIAPRSSRCATMTNDHSTAPVQTCQQLTPHVLAMLVKNFMSSFLQT